MDYHILREIADSWVLLLMFVFFVGTWFWAFRPGSKPTHDDAASLVFRNDNAPLADDAPASRAKATNIDPEGQS